MVITDIIYESLSDIARNIYEDINNYFIFDLEMPENMLMSFIDSINRIRKKDDKKILFEYLKDNTSFLTEHCREIVAKFTEVTLVDKKTA